MVDAIIWLIIAYFMLRLITTGIMETNAYKEHKQELLEQADRMVREVELEVLKEHNTVLAYDKENNNFLGQAATIEAVKELLKERFPRKIFLIEGDGKNEIVTALPVKDLT